jgi:hypothetical protein
MGTTSRYHADREVEPMTVRYSCCAVLGLVILAALFLPQSATAELTARLMTDPKPVGPDVRVDGFLFEGGSLATARLALKNASTNLLTIDGARSTLAAAGGEARPLGTLLGTEFVTSLLPGAQTSDTLDILAPVQAGDRLTLHLVWTLGAIVSSATWVWEIADTSASAAPVAPQATPAEPARSSQPAAPTTAPVTAADNGGSDTLLGLIGLMAGLALIGLVAWGIWALTR